MTATAPKRHRTLGTPKRVVFNLADNYRPAPTLLTATWSRDGKGCGGTAKAPELAPAQGWEVQVEQAKPRTTPGRAQRGESRVPVPEGWHMTLRAALLSRGWSVPKAAAALKIPRQTLSYWTSGRASMAGKEQFDRINAALGLDLAVLFPSAPLPPRVVRTITQERCPAHDLRILRIVTHAGGCSEAALCGCPVETRCPACWRAQEMGK